MTRYFVNDKKEKEERYGCQNEKVCVKNDL
jgi:hypothetical protein